MHNVLGGRTCLFECRWKSKVKRNLRFLPFTHESWRDCNYNNTALLPHLLVTISNCSRGPEIHLYFLTQWSKGNKHRPFISNKGLTSRNDIKNITILTHVYILLMFPEKRTPVNLVRDKTKVEGPGGEWKWRRLPWGKGDSRMVNTQMSAQTLLGVEPETLVLWDEPLLLIFCKTISQEKHLMNCIKSIHWGANRRSCSRWWEFIYWAVTCVEIDWPNWWIFEGMEVGVLSWPTIFKRCGKKLISPKLQEHLAWQK